MIITQITKALLFVLGRMVSVLITVFTWPIARFVVTVMPDTFDHFDTSINAFFTQHLIPGLAFAREVFFNVTGYPRVLFAALILVFTGKLALRIGFIAFRFFIKIYFAFRGSPKNT